MDTSRWLVVLSVIFCMTTVLTTLNRSANNKNISHLEKNNEVIEQNDINQDKEIQIIFKKSATQKYKPKAIRFTKPPKHLFEMDTNQDAQNEQKEIKTKGLILD